MEAANRQIDRQSCLQIILASITFCLWKENHDTFNITSSLLAMRWEMLPACDVSLLLFLLDASGWISKVLSLTAFDLPEVCVLVREPDLWIFVVFSNTKSSIFLLHCQPYWPVFLSSIFLLNHSIL